MLNELCRRIYPHLLHGDNSMSSRSSPRLKYAVGCVLSTWICMNKEHFVALQTAPHGTAPRSRKELAVSVRSAV